MKLVILLITRYNEIISIFKSIFSLYGDVYCVSVEDIFKKRKVSLAVMYVPLQDFNILHLVLLS